MTTKRGKFDRTFYNRVTCPHCHAELYPDDGKLPRHYQRGTIRLVWPGVAEGVDCPASGKSVSRTISNKGTRE